MEKALLEFGVKVLNSVGEYRGVQLFGQRI